MQKYVVQQIKFVLFLSTFKDKKTTWSFVELCGVNLTLFPVSDPKCRDASGQSAALSTGTEKERLTSSPSLMGCPQSHPNLKENMIQASDRVVDFTNHNHSKHTSIIECDYMITQRTENLRRQQR